MDLDSRHLRLVAEVARAGSVTHAAARLHVTQSAVSHQLREIEERLGLRLFVRSGRRMLPSAAGQILIGAAERVLAEITRAEEGLGRMAREGSGELRVCAQCHTGYHWLPPLLDTIRGRHPACEVRLLVEHTFAPLDALLDGKLDVAIVTRATRDPRVELRPLFRDEHVAVVHRQHPWISLPYVALEALAREPLYLYSSSLETAFVVKDVLRPAGLEPVKVSFVQLTEAILEMVKARLGVSVLPRWSIVPALESGAVKAVPIGPAGVFREWQAATLRGAPYSPVMDDFISTLATNGATLGITRRSTDRRARPLAEGSSGRRRGAGSSDTRARRARA